jgi:serine phosphatase RsbU (regulator of sigma subunit)/ligand-binding sensor domain-containing protein
MLSAMLISFPWVHADTGNAKFGHLTIREGLSQSSVRDILQDSRGFLWFATVDGLNRYDGYSFNILKPDPDNPNSIASPFLRSIIEDRNGILWIGTNGEGFDRYDPATGQFAHFRNDPANPDSLSFNYVWKIHEDRSGILWLGTDGGGLNRFDPETGHFTHYRHDPSNPRGISHDRVLGISEDGNGILWIATRGGGLNRFDPETGYFTYYRHEPGNPDSLSDDYTWTVYADPEDGVWVGTLTGGVNRLNPETGGFTHYRHEPGNPDSLSNNEVHAIFRDRRGTLWVGTNGGICKLDEQTGRFTRYSHNPNNPDSLSNNHILCAYEDRSGVLWFGTEVGGVNKLDRNQEHFQHYRKNPAEDDASSLPDNRIWSIYEDSSGGLWVGTRDRGFARIDRKTGESVHYGNDPSDPRNLRGRYVRCLYAAPSEPGILWVGVDGIGVIKFGMEAGQALKHYRHDPLDPHSLSSDRVYTVYEDRSGVLWVGTRFGGLNRFDREKERFTRYRNDPNNPKTLSNDYLYDILEDRRGGFWIGTFAGGLNRMDRQTGTFTAFRHQPGRADTISSNCILCIHEDGSGTIWLGTGGGGLSKLQRDSGAFKNYGAKEGLPNAVIYGILEDDNHNLWLSTNNGLCRFNTNNESVKNYTDREGLQSNEFNGGSYFRSPRTGEMFFGGINGFNAFYPERIKDNTYAPPVVITAFRKFNREVILEHPITEVEEITLSYRDYVFSFEFAALDFTVPGKNQYAYMMKGLDEDWIRTGAWNRIATYTTLKPGEYEFLVKGSNNDGTWNDAGKSIKVIITPPYWQTWWFELLAVLAGLAVVVWLYKRRTRRLFSRARLETELQTAHTAQMSIMPQENPKIEGFDIAGMCLPAHEVGGDFYDYLWLDSADKQFGIAVGDVSGKAMKAAMPAVMSNGIIHSKASETGSIKEIMSRLNYSLCAKTDKRVFTALLMTAIDTQTNTLTYINAGIPEPLLKSGDKVIRLERAGSSIPLGITPNIRLIEQSVQLKGGDLVVLYTDGLSETWDAEENFYGSKRLKELLQKIDASVLDSMTSDELIREIVKDIKRFSHDAELRDDMTIVVVKVL